MTVAPHAQGAMFNMRRPKELKPGDKVLTYGSYYVVHSHHPSITDSSKTVVWTRNAANPDRPGSTPPLPDEPFVILVQ